jgi:hypothetical protein
MGVLIESSRWRSVGFLRALNYCYSDSTTAVGHFPSFEYIQSMTYKSPVCVRNRTLANTRHNADGMLGFKIVAQLLRHVR